jgi:hypothetical protein
MKCLMTQHNRLTGGMLTAADQRGFARILDEQRGWLHRQRSRREITEGCRAMSDICREMEQAYHPLEEEVSHSLDIPSRGGLNSNLETWYTSV